MPVAAIAELSLQSVVVGNAEILQHVDLADAAVHGQDGPSEIGGRDGSDLSGRRAEEGGGRVEIHGAIEVGPVLMHVVATEE